MVKNLEFGFNMDSFNVKRDTIQFGDSFGEIMEKIKLDTLKFIKLPIQLKILLM